MGVVTFLFTPLRWYKKYVIDKVLEALYIRFQGRIDNTAEVFVKASVGAVTFSVIIWASIFLYVAFYYTYMPSISHSRPVYFQFDPCEEKRGICSYPSAKVNLTRRQSLLMVGQQYKLSLNLEMPESPVNKKLGMFMACFTLYDRSGTFISKSCRSSMLHYKSFLLEIMSTVFLSPLLIFGSKEEKQTVTFEMYNGFEDDQIHPVTDVFVEIQTRYIELYSASLNINAHFTGLRYLMYNWPIVSAIIGIFSNMFFITIIFGLSWLHIMRSGSVDEYEVEYIQREPDIGSRESSPFIGDISQDDLSLIDDNGKQSESDIPLSESRDHSEGSEVEAFDLVTSSSVEVIGS